jgi:hypothetical protein
MGRRLARKRSKRSIEKRPLVSQPKEPSCSRVGSPAKWRPLSALSGSWRRHDGRIQSIISSAVTPCARKAPAIAPADAPTRMSGARPSSSMALIAPMCATPFVAPPEATNATRGRAAIITDSSNPQPHVSSHEWGGRAKPPADQGSRRSESPRIARRVISASWRRTDAASAELRKRTRYWRSALRASSRSPRSSAEISE